MNTTFEDAVSFRTPLRVTKKKCYFRMVMYTRFAQGAKLLSKENIKIIVTAAVNVFLGKDFIVQRLSNGSHNTA